MSSANLYAHMSGLKDYVAAQLPTYLRAVESEIGITIADPAEHMLGYREVLSADRYPLVCYVASDFTPEPSGQGSQWLVARADVVVAYKHSVPATLEKVLLGYSDALINLVGEHEDLGGICDVAVIEYGDLYHGAPGSKDIGMVLVTVTMRSELRT